MCRICLSFGNSEICLCNSLQEREAAYIIETVENTDKGAQSMDVMTILNGILVIFGLYMTAAGLRMKKTGELSPMLLAPEEIAACRDKDTFIRFMYWREAAFGGGTAILGVLGLVNDLVLSVKFFPYAKMAAFLAAFVWFACALKSARASYL